MNRFAPLTEIAAALVLFVVGCGEGPTPIRHVDHGIATSLILDRDAASLEEGDTIRLHATVNDDLGTAMPNAGIIWKSEDAAHATVDANGLVTVVLAPPGRVFVAITATHKPAGRAAIADTATISTTYGGYLDLWPSENGLIPGMQRTVEALLVKSLADYPNPDVRSVAAESWTSTDPAVVTIDGSGRITAIAPRYAQIRALYRGKTVMTDVAEVYVDPAPSPALSFVSVYGSQAQIQTRAQGDNLFGPYYAPRACGLTDGGDVYCWGVAQKWMSGHLDMCDTVTRGPGIARKHTFYQCTEVPQKLPSDVKFKSLATRGDQSCAIAVSGQVRCWGWNRGGELALGSPDTVEHLPAPIASSDNFSSLHLAAYSTDVRSDLVTCALRVDSVAVCWETSFGFSPKPVPGFAWRSMADIWPCGIGADSSAYCTATGAPQRVWGAAKWTATWSDKDGGFYAIDLGGTVHGGTITGSPSARPVADPIVSLNTYVSDASQFTSRPCGLTMAGDLYCFETPTPSLANPGGMRLRQYFGRCGIALDLKAYCWEAGVWTRVLGQS